VFVTIIYILVQKIEKVKKKEAYIE